MCRLQSIITVEIMQMSKIQLTLLKFLMLSSLKMAIAYQETKVLEFPKIGVLVNGILPKSGMQEIFPKKTSFLVASNVKFLEMCGAKVVPIWLGRERSYYVNIMGKVNGLLLPDGGNWKEQISSYRDAVKILLDIAIEMNDKKIYMPVWGTCLGMQALIYHLAKGYRQQPGVSCSSNTHVATLKLTNYSNESRLFAGIQKELLDTASSLNTTIDTHGICFTEQNFRIIQMDKVWRALTVSTGSAGEEIISTIEHIKYPFYGIVFHPEYARYEYNAEETEYCMLMLQVFGRFFITESERNPNKFHNTTELFQVLIYNYKPEYTGLLGWKIMQTYVFPEEPANCNQSLPKLATAGAATLFKASVAITLSLWAALQSTY